jgi:energy-coupling factor transport system ATP-binding protein
MIVFDNVDFAYRSHKGEDICALEGINLTVAKGESLLVLGGNGSGKTTLLKLARGLLSPTRGDVRIKGADTATERAKLSRIVSFVLSRPGDMIFSPIVEEDIAFGLECRGLPPEEIRYRVDRSLETVGMARFAKARIYRLSGGEQQKIVLAGALVQNPDVLLLDEPTAYLDSGESRRMMERVKKLQDSMTIILATQRPDPVFRPDRVLVLHEGKTVFCGPQADLHHRAGIMKAAGLAPPKTVLLGERLRKKGVPVKDPSHTPELLVKQLCKLWSQTSPTSAAN